MVPKGGFVIPKGGFIPPKPSGGFGSRGGVVLAEVPVDIICNCNNNNNNKELIYRVDSRMDISLIFGLKKNFLQTK